MLDEKSIPSFYDIQDIFINEEKAEVFLFENEIFYPKSNCECCNKPTKREGKMWRCINSACRKSVSIARGSFFNKVKLKYSQILFISYLWLTKATTNTIRIITGHSSKTICDFIKYLTQLVSNNINEEECIIGGPGIEVEIDECKIAKRKYNRGHFVEGAWIFGGVERTNERRVFVEVVANRSAETLKEIIFRRIHQGSTIISDCWKAYSSLESYGYTHKTVNHSQNFRDPITLAHTNTIEGTWSGIKRQIPIRNRNSETVGDHLLLYIWKRQNEKTLWKSLICAMKDTFYE